MSQVLAYALLDVYRSCVTCALCLAEGSGEPNKPRQPMKQTPPAGLCFRREPPPTQAVEWRTVRPSPPLPATPGTRQSAPWGPFIIAAGLVAAAFIVANGNKPSPPAEPKTVSPSEGLVTVNQSEPVAPRAQPVIWPRAEAAGATTLFSPEVVCESYQSRALGLSGDPARGPSLDPLPGSATEYGRVAQAPQPLGRIFYPRRNLGLDDSSRRNDPAVGGPVRAGRPDSRPPQTGNRPSAVKTG